MSKQHRISRTQEQQARANAYVPDPREEATEQAQEVAEEAIEAQAAGHVAEAQEALQAAAETSPPAQAFEVAAPSPEAPLFPPEAPEALTERAEAWLAGRGVSASSYRDGILTVVAYPDVEKKRFWEEVEAEA